LAAAALARGGVQRGQAVGTGAAQGGAGGVGIIVGGGERTELDVDERLRAAKRAPHADDGRGVSGLERGVGGFGLGADDLGLSKSELCACKV
jgi:hypothetical protein